MRGSKEKHYLDIDVLTAAKKRIREVIMNFDKLYVCFSGGKDSLVTLHLVEEVYREMGLKDKVNVIFRDEEVIPSVVVNFVQSYAESGKYNFDYYAVPLKSNKYILGRTYDYVQWDANRKHMRNPPPYAITLPPGDNRIFDQYTMDDFCTRNDKCKCCLLLGMRADESFYRLVGCLKGSWLMQKSRKVYIAKPIYDWCEKDIFKFLYERNIQPCPIYDIQAFNNEALRVSTPLHAESAKRMFKIKSRDALFFEQIMEIFPEVRVQAMYYKDLNTDCIVDSYPHTVNGIIKYIDDEIQDPIQNRTAKKKLESCWKSRCKRIAENPSVEADRLGGFPVLYLFEKIIAGAFKRQIPPCQEVTQRMKDYEENKN